MLFLNFSKIKKRFIDVDFPQFNFAKCAEGFGCYGEVVTDPNELKPALERAKNSNKPAVIDVKIKFEILNLIEKVRELDDSS